MVKIALDAGHGYYTAGKRTPDGQREWSFNNKVLLACQAKLNKYKNVDILRLDDPTGNTDIPLTTRTNKANSWKADVVVSIHQNANAGVWGSHGGTETYVQKGASKVSFDIAKEVHPRLVKAMGLRDRGIKTSNLHMTRETKCPAILTEGAFMDSTTDIHTLRDDNKLEAQGEAIADGLIAYFKLAPKSPEVSKVEEKPQEVATNINDGKVEYLNLPKWQRAEMSTIYRQARELGIFTSEQHEKNVLEGKMTYEQALFLMTVISGAALNNGKRVQ